MRGGIISIQRGSAAVTGVDDLRGVQVRHPRPQARHVGHLQPRAPSSIVQNAEADDGSPISVPDQRESGDQSPVLQTISSIHSSRPQNHLQRDNIRQNFGSISQSQSSLYKVIIIFSSSIIK